MHLYGVIGKPLTHSLSPALHNWGFARSGHLGTYLTWEKNAEDLPAFFAAVRSLPIAGLSVTIPHKEAVIPFLDDLTPRARAVGAVNLVYWEQWEERERLLGDNTDVAGFLAPLQTLREAGKTLPPRALLLGAGGAARACLTGLSELGIADVWITARTAEKAEALARDFGCQALPWENREKSLAERGPALVINATPLGMAGEFAGQSPLPNLGATAADAGAASCPPAWIIYDTVYNPSHTPLLNAARALGMTCANGLDFFVAQAQEQFRRWTGSELPGAAARELILGLLKK